MLMDILEYTAFFHDGSLINIEYKNHKLIFFMQSAEIVEEDLPSKKIISKNHKILPDNISLSNENCFTGKLHINGIKSITAENNSFSDILKMEYDNGRIFDFNLKKNSVEISIIWLNYPPKPEIEKFSTFFIIAETISWENIPNLFE